MSEVTREEMRNCFLAMAPQFYRYGKRTEEICSAILALIDSFPTAPDEGEGCPTCGADTHPKSCGRCVHWHKNPNLYGFPGDGKCIHPKHKKDAYILHTCDDHKPCHKPPADTPEPQGEVDRWFYCELTKESRRAEEMERDGEWMNLEDQKERVRMLTAVWVRLKGWKPRPPANTPEPSEGDEIVGVLWRNPERMGGAWCVWGTRIPIEAVLRDIPRVKPEPQGEMRHFTKDEQEKHSEIIGEIFKEVPSDQKYPSEHGAIETSITGTPKPRPTVTREWFWEQIELAYGATCAAERDYHINRIAKEIGVEVEDE